MHFAAILQVVRTQRRRLFCLTLAPVMLAWGCESMSNTDKGILGGAGIGAVAGGLLGAAVHRPVAGAALGAAAGGVTGGVIGNAEDRSEQKQAVLAAAAARGGMGLTDVASLAQQHVSDDIIISQIRTTGSVFRLSPNDIVWLKSNNVSDVVIQEMQLTATRPYARVYAPGPVVYQPTAVIVDPGPPPPPVGVGVGFSYGYGRRW